MRFSRLDLHSDGPYSECSTGQDEECDSQDGGCDSTSTPDTTEGAESPAESPTERHCDSQDGGCGTDSPGDTAAEEDQCESQDGGCGNDEDQSPTPVPEQACGDDIDNDADGQVDAADNDCEVIFPYRYFQEVVVE